jgi:hypothetical protein
MSSLLQQEPKTIEKMLIAFFLEFKGGTGLSMIAIDNGDKEPIYNIADSFLWNSPSRSDVSQDDKECILQDVGYLVFEILREKPIISLGKEPIIFNSGLAHQDINERYALFVALRLLHLKQGDMYKSKQVTNDLIEIFRGNNVSVETI